MMRSTLAFLSLLTCFNTGSFAQAGYPTLGSPTSEFNYTYGPADVKCPWVENMCFKHGGLAVYGAGTGLADSITLRWDPEQAPVTVNQSRAAARQYLPTDAVYVRQTTSRAGSPVDIYQSKWLAMAFGSKSIQARHDMWDGQTPGTFIVIHTPRYKTTIATGNNP